MAWKPQVRFGVTDTSTGEWIPAGETSEVSIVIGVAECLRRQAAQRLADAEKIDPAVAMVARGHLADITALCSDLLEMVEPDEAEMPMLEMVPAPVPRS